MRTIILIYTTGLLLFSACSEKKLGPLVDIGGKPGPISNISVENKNGASKISYTLPADQQLLYVLAEYALRNGEIRSVKSSIFKGFVELEGFVSTDEREVTLYTVNRSEEKSDPIQVTIKPLVSPLEIAYESLKPTADFGGVNVKYENEFEHEYVLNFLYKNENGEWLEYDRSYASVKEPVFTFRGLEAKPQDFAFYLADKWQNLSDTLYQNITPLYEAEVDKGLMKHYPLDNDYYTPVAAARPITNLWNGVGPGNYSVQVYEGLTFPWWGTIDLGKEYRLGRMKLYPSDARSGDRYSFFFAGITPRIFEIWGSNEPTLDGSWNSWTLLERFESIKPSGQPIGENSPDDVAAALAGLDFTFSNHEQGYRYIRINVIDSWSSQIGMILQELTFWGAPVE